MSDNPYFQRQAAASREKAVRAAKQTPKRVDGEDHAYQERRAEIAILRCYARKYPDVVLEIVVELKSA